MRALLILYAVVFILQLAVGRMSGFPVESFFGFSPVSFFSGRIWQVVTYSFLHADLLTHLLFNLLVLYMLGTELEWRWGHAKFLRYYLICAIGGAIVHTLVWLALMLIAPAYAVGLGNTPIIGASGALYGLFIAFGMLNGEAQVLVFFVVPMKARQFVMILTAIEVVSAVFFSDKGVAHLVHLGGMLAGYLMIKFQGPNLSGRGGGLFRKRGTAMSRDEVRSRLRVITNQENKKGDKGLPITWNRQARLKLLPVDG
ncbi:MAG: rhomboid family intramembrane serine protease, partial [Bdellovibrionota bacterium]